MIFTETKLKGAFILDLERREDDRGFFARAFCQHEFGDHGLEAGHRAGQHRVQQLKGTVRGMHFQFPPAAETKLVRCTRGAILDVIVDLRPESPTYLEHVAVELTADNRRATLRAASASPTATRCSSDNTETSYQVGEFYTPAPSGGLRYDDPRLGSRGRSPVTVISDKDANWRAARRRAERELDAAHDRERAGARGRLR